MLKSKIIILNIAAILLLLVLAELSAWLMLFFATNFGAQSLRKNSDSNKLLFPRYYFTSYPWKQQYSWIFFREPEGLQYNKRPVIIFGCSFAYGDRLEVAQTLGYKLANLAKRPVYNRAFLGWGIQHMLWQLQNEPKLDDIKNPEYVIYVFMNDHLRRLRTDYFQPNERVYAPFNSPYMTYVEKNGKLEVKKHPFQTLYSSIFVDYLAYYLGCGKHSAAEHGQKQAEKLAEFTKLHFLTSKAIIDKKYPGTKFVILDYFNLGDVVWDIVKKDLKDEGFIILNACDLAGVDLSLQDYTLPNDPHPNEHAWDLITLTLIKKLDIK